MQSVSILGSTGSIGRQVLDVIRQVNKKKPLFKVISLAAGNNKALLQEQIDEFQPEVYSSLPEEPCLLKSDIIFSNIVGKAGLKPTLRAIDLTNFLALANKESLVCGGNQVMSLANKNNVTIYPIDSEHHAIYECLKGIPQDKIKKIILTASGGPFFGMSFDEIKDKTAKDALAHPTWSMGAKITIDSATLMNKALEVIEAHHLFNLPYDMIDIIVHRESIVHSMVELKNGSVIAQMAVPDMRLPILSALEEVSGESFSEGIIANLDLSAKPLTFYKPDFETFKCFNIGIAAGKMGDKAAEEMNDANEDAVAKFLSGEIKFGEIHEEITRRLTTH